MKKPNIREAINQALSKYQVTIEELEEMYPTDRENTVVMIDGIKWCDYFYVPEEVQTEIIRNWQKKYKTKFGYGWFEMPSTVKSSKYCDLLIGDQTLINNRNELLKIWE